MKFLLLSTQRSGSHLLRKYLGSHPQLECEDEIEFNKQIAIKALKENIKGFKGLYLDGKHKSFLLKYDKDFPLGVLDHLPENSGFLVQYNQLDPQINLSGVNVIHLIRKNLLERAISVYINKYQLWGSKVDHLTKGNQFQADFSRRFKVSRWEIKRTIADTKEQILFWDAKLRKEGANCLTIDYDDIFSDRSLTREWEENEQPVKMPEAVAEKMCRFLGVECHEMTSPLKRVNTPNYQDYIINWKRIERLREIVLV